MPRKSRKSIIAEKKANSSSVNFQNGGKVTKKQPINVRKAIKTTNSKCQKCSKQLSNYNKNRSGVCVACLKNDSTVHNKSKNIVSSKASPKSAKRVINSTKKSNRNTYKTNDSPKTSSSKVLTKDSSSTKTTSIKSGAKAPKEQLKSKSAISKPKQPQASKMDTMRLRGNKRSYTELASGLSIDNESELKKRKVSINAEQSVKRESRSKKPTVKASEWMSTVQSKRISHTKQEKIKKETSPLKKKSPKSNNRLRNNSRGKQTKSPKVIKTANVSKTNKVETGVTQVSRKPIKRILKNNEVQGKMSPNAKKQKVATKTTNSFKTPTHLYNTRDKKISNYSKTKIGAKNTKANEVKTNNIIKSGKKQIDPSSNDKNDSSILDLPENVLISKDILNDLLNSIPPVLHHDVDENNKVESDNGNECGADSATSSNGEHVQDTGQSENITSSGYNNDIGDLIHTNTDYIQHNGNSELCYVQNSGDLTTAKSILNLTDSNEQDKNETNYSNSTPKKNSKLPQELCDERNEDKDNVVCNSNLDISETSYESSDCNSSRGKLNEISASSKPDDSGQKLLIKNKSDVLSEGKDKNKNDGLITKQVVLEELPSNESKTIIDSKSEQSGDKEIGSCNVKLTDTIKEDDVIMEDLSVFETANDNKLMTKLDANVGSVAIHTDNVSGGIEDVSTDIFECKKRMTKSIINTDTKWEQTENKGSLISQNSSVDINITDCTTEANSKMQDLITSSDDSKQGSSKEIVSTDKLAIKEDGNDNKLSIDNEPTDNTIDSIKDISTENVESKKVTSNYVTIDSKLELSVNKGTFKSKTDYSKTILTNNTQECSTKEDLSVNASLEVNKPVNNKCDPDVEIEIQSTEEVGDVSKLSIVNENSMIKTVDNNVKNVFSTSNIECNTTVLNSMNTDKSENGEVDNNSRIEMNRVDVEVTSNNPEATSTMEDLSVIVSPNDSNPINHKIDKRIDVDIIPSNEVEDVSKLSIDRPSTDDNVCDKSKDVSTDDENCSTTISDNLNGNEESKCEQTDDRNALGDENNSVTVKVNVNTPEGSSTMEDLSVVASSDDVKSLSEVNQNIVMDKSSSSEVEDVSKLSIDNPCTDNNVCDKSKDVSTDENCTTTISDNINGNEESKCEQTDDRNALGDENNSVTVKVNVNTPEGSSTMEDLSVVASSDDVKSLSEVNQNIVMDKSSSSEVEDVSKLSIDNPCTDNNVCDKSKDVSTDDENCTTAISDNLNGNEESKCEQTNDRNALGDENSSVTVKINVNTPEGSSTMEDLSVVASSDDVKSLSKVDQNICTDKLLSCKIEDVTNLSIDKTYMNNIVIDQINDGSVKEVDCKNSTCDVNTSEETDNRDPFESEINHVGAKVTVDNPEDDSKTGEFIVSLNDGKTLSKMVDETIGVDKLSSKVEDVSILSMDNPCTDIIDNSEDVSINIINKECNSEHTDNSDILCDETSSVAVRINDNTEDNSTMDGISDIASSEEIKPLNLLDEHIERDKLSSSEEVEPIKMVSKNSINTDESEETGDKSMLRSEVNHGDVKFNVDTSEDESAMEDSSVIVSSDKGKPIMEQLEPNIDVCKISSNKVDDVSQLAMNIDGKCGQADVEDTVGQELVTGSDNASEDNVKSINEHDKPIESDKLQSDQVDYTTKDVNGHDNGGHNNEVKESNENLLPIGESKTTNNDSGANNVVNASSSHLKGAIENINEPSPGETIGIENNTSSIAAFNANIKVDSVNITIKVQTSNAAHVVSVEHDIADNLNTHGNNISNETPAKKFNDSNLQKDSSPKNNFHQLNMSENEELVKNKLDQTMHNIMSSNVVDESVYTGPSIHPLSFDIKGVPEEVTKVDDDVESMQCNSDTQSSNRMSVDEDNTAMDIEYMSGENPSSGMSVDCEMSMDVN